MSFNERLNEATSSKLLSKADKIKQLKNIILDLTNEMEAEDQNMHPEVNHNLAIKLQEATDALRKLEAGIETMGTDEICEKIIHDSAVSEHSSHSPEVEDIKDICRSPKNKK
jgi:hypothetical protein|tara:strand:+ start:57168 stop:57503 length:336 start_codon:yes stop_codon:yes gene_type:complete